LESVGLGVGVPLGVVYLVFDDPIEDLVPELVPGLAGLTGVTLGYCQVCAGVLPFAMTYLPGMAELDYAFSLRLNISGFNPIKCEN
jgi:hypothetical protein